MSKYDNYGGYFAPKGVMRVEAGGSHAENPNGGVQIGVDQQGVPNLLEEGEPVFNDYVFSDNIYAKGGVLKKFNVPERFAGKLYSEIADYYINEVDGMELDPIANRGLNANLVRLMNAQEEQKMQKERRELEKMLSQMSPEELAALEQELAAAEGGQEMPVQEQVPVDQQMMAQAPVGEATPMEMPVEQAPVMAACGGSINRFDTGGNVDNPPFAVRDASSTRFTANRGYVPEHDFDAESETAARLAAGDQFVNSMIPFVGIPDTIEMAADDWRNGQRGQAVFGALSAVPFFGSGSKSVMLGAKAKKKAKTAGAIIKAGNAAGKKNKANAVESSAERMAREESVEAAGKELEAAATMRAEAQTEAERKLADEMVEEQKKVYNEKRKQLKEFDKNKKDTGDKKKGGWGWYAVPIGLTAASLWAANKMGGGSDVEMEDNVSKEFNYDSMKSNYGTDYANGGRLGNIYKFGTPGLNRVLGPFFQKEYRIYDNRPHKTEIGTGTFIRPASSQIWQPTLATTYPREGYWQTGTGFGLLPEGEIHRDYVTALPSEEVQDNSEEVQDNYAYLLPEDYKYAMMQQYVQSGNGNRNSAPKPNTPVTSAGNTPTASVSSVASDVVTEPRPENVVLPWSFNRFWTPSELRLPGIGIEMSDADFNTLDITDPTVPALTPARPSLGPKLTKIDTRSESGLAKRTPLSEIPAAKNVTVGNPGRGLLTTLPRYAGVVGNSIAALSDAFAKPDTMVQNYAEPVLPVGRMDLQPVVYNPTDMNHLANMYAAQMTGANRMLRNSGLGPSVGANIIAANNAGMQNLGSALLQGRATNNQLRNEVIAANNQSAAQKANFDYTLDAARANILNDYRYRRAMNDLHVQQYNNAQDTAKWTALGQQLGNVWQGLSDIGNENFAMNQVNTNPALFYRTTQNGGVYYDPMHSDYLEYWRDYFAKHPEEL